MTKHRISETEAAALLRGDASSVSPELGVLASAVAEFRASAFEQAPQPSAALLARLESNTATEAVVPLTAGAVSRRRRIRHMLSWLTGLGVLAKIALGSTVAAAAVVGAGAAGVLPPGAQNTFDTVVSSVVPLTEDDPEGTPTESPTPEPTETGDSEEGDSEEGSHPDNFGGFVSELAHDKSKNADGPFGQTISEAAHNKKNAGADGEDGTESESEDESESETEPESETGTETGPGSHGGGKPEGTPGGGKKK